MQPLKIGIVGYGWAASAHIEAFKEVNGATVDAICSRRTLDPANLQAEHGLPLKAYTSFADMLADPEIGAIDICTPPSLHAELAIQAADAGKHVLIEKPIAMNFADCLRIEEALRRNNVQGGVCFECRYSKHFSLVRSMIDQGLLGDLHYAEVDYFHGIGPWYGQFPWNVKKEHGGSSLLTAGCHALDAMLFFMDSPVVEVTSYQTRSQSEIFKPYEYNTSSTTLLRFENGHIGKVASIVDCLQPYYFHVHLCGSEGSILDNQFHSNKLDGLVKDGWSQLNTALIDSGDVADHPYQPQFQEFTDACAENRPMARTDFATALQTHRVVFAADLSAQEGRSVRVDEIS
ncbi:MAG: Gfo/Idh/MocA family oxidoreductase [Planctomycetes bacterium]|nr:Gfo/Idh/MocA family oxidoreductase [Planctomycetota bacterium]